MTAMETIDVEEMAVVIKSIATCSANLIAGLSRIATAFPGTSSVESDFSIVNWEKDDCRIALTDLSLEGIFHSKQFDKISPIVH
jgi:hypothetical protein